MRRARQARLREARLARPLLLAAGGLLLSACSSLKLTYNNLDWLVDWQLRRYVDLSPPQRTLLDERFGELWQWHRGTQLALYVADLRALSQAVDRPLPPAEIESWVEKSRVHGVRALDEVLPRAAELLRALDDAQVEQLLTKAAERRREEIEERDKLSEEELREESAERMEERLERWVGSLNREQRALVRRWAENREYARALWRQVGDQWFESFRSALAHRREPDFADRLRALFGEGQPREAEAVARVRQHNRTLWIAMISELSASLSPKQREHLRRRLHELAADLEELSRQSRQAAGPQVIG